MKIKKVYKCNSQLTATAVLHILQGDQALVLLVGPFLRTSVGNIAAEVAYATTKAKVQPSLALENIREKNFWAHTPPIRCSRTAGLSECQRNRSHYLIPPHI